MNTSIRDKFQDLERFGNAPVPFTLTVNHSQRADIPKWRIQRSNARSMGKATFMHTKPCARCGGLEMRVYDVTCAECHKRGFRK